MKILLSVLPKYYHKFWDIRHYTYPIGIWSIASFLENQFEASIKIIDCIAAAPSNIGNIKDDIAKMGLSDQSLIAEIRKYSPDLIGLQCISSNQHNAILHYSNLIKNYFPNTSIVVGGAHASALPKRILTDAAGTVDYVIIGEGEKTFLELAQSLQKDSSTNIKHIKGLGCWNQGNILINKDRELIADFDSLPLLNPDFFKEINYPQDPPHSYFTFGRKWIEVMFSRGCTFNCDWCFSPRMWKRQLRKLSVDRANQQLELLWDYGYRELLIEDDNLFLEPDWGKKIINLIKKFGFFWQVAGGLSLEGLNAELIDYISESQCTTVYIPINVIRKIGQPNVELLLKDKYVDVFKRFNKNGVYIYSSIILGIPDQSIEDMKQQINFAHYLVSQGWVNYCVIFAFSPLPGTSWWDKIIERGDYKFQNNEIKWEQFSNHVPCAIDTPYWNFNEVEDLISSANEYINGKEKALFWRENKQWIKA